MKAESLMAGFVAAASVAATFVLGCELSRLSIAGDETAIGARMQNGAVYAGKSPNTGKPIYTTPEDAPGIYTFAKANSYCAGLDANGHRDWRVPTLKELNVLFNNRAAVGGFNETGSYPAGWYWSSTESSDVSAWQRRFSDGYTWYRFEGVSEEFGSSLRCVRG